MRRTIPAALVALAIACSRAGGPPPPPEDVSYGYAPDPGGTAKYQPDVILIGGGSRAIRSASPDGLIWLMDGAAPGVRDLAPGRVMFATSRVVGRVVRLEERRGDVAVTLEPVAFTEVVRDADINLDAALDPESVTFRRVPDLLQPAPSQAVWFPHDAAGYRLMMASTGPAAARAGVLRLARSDAQNAVARRGGMEVSLQGFTIKLSLAGENNATALGLQVVRKEGPLRAGVEVKLLTRKLRVRTSMPVRAGAVDPSMSFVIEGIEELRLGLDAGSQNGLADNTKVRIEVPLEAIVDVPPSPETGGLPMVVMMKTKFILTTAFSARNSTLGGLGRYGLTGPLGYQGGTIVTPAFSVISPMMSSIQGVSVGASGFVFASEMKFLAGFGLHSAAVGPFGKLTTAFGVSYGSGIGLVRCKGLTVKLDAAVGVGAELSSEVGGVLEKILGKKVASRFDVLENSTTIVHRSATNPDVPLCRG